MPFQFILNCFHISFISFHWNDFSKTESWKDRPQGPVSQKSLNFSGYIILFVSSKRRRLEPRNFAVILFCYSLYNIWKDQLHRISGSEFYEWLFGPEKFRDFRETGPRSYLIERLCRRKSAATKLVSPQLCWSELWVFFISSNASLNIPFLHNMLSLIVKTNVNGVSRDVCEFFSGQ